ncbi:uncharacterized protein LOC111352115 [Spodoptera litura]|uniref:Uncharacterized protein LOC111352115 n=1 Tax=Spodoptera litura TaxID=69820 RepID=A0A9J7DZJ7_SPOLT|nr:uncharacterized protein LOC111352115 [Spodoptera litura]
MYLLLWTLHIPQFSFVEVMFPHNILFVSCLILGIQVIKSLEVIPERANVTFSNPEYASNVRIYVRRFRRNSANYINFMGTNKQTWTNNITIDFTISQYLNYEYRPTYVGHYKFCDLVNREPFIGGAIKNSGLVCPLPAGYHAVRNITAPTENFPNVFPFEKGRIDFTASLTSTSEPVLKLFIEARFKQN